EITFKFNPAALNARRVPAEGAVGERPVSEMQRDPAAVVSLIPGNVNSRPRQIAKAINAAAITAPDIEVVGVPPADGHAAEGDGQPVWNVEDAKVRRRIEIPPHGEQIRARASDGNRVP